MKAEINIMTEGNNKNNRNNTLTIHSSLKKVTTRVLYLYKKHVHLTRVVSDFHLYPCEDLYSKMLTPAFFVILRKILSYRCTTLALLK